jgi:cytidylate kinase
LHSPFSKGKEQEKKKTGVTEEVSAASSSHKKHLSNRKKQWKQGEIIVFNTADILDDCTIDTNVNSYLTASKSERLSADAGSGVSVRRRDQNKARAVDRVTKAGGDPAFLETFHRENADDLV